MMGRWVAGIVVLFGILLMLLPGTDEQSVSRIGSASMLACTKDIRNTVAEQLLEKKPVSVTVDIEKRCSDLVKSLEVNRSGEMLITGDKHPVTMRLSPVIENGKVRWSCRGEPREAVTRLCKP